MRQKSRKLTRKGPCHTYWGTHGCKKQAGHIGRHYCENTCPRGGDVIKAIHDDGSIFVEYVFKTDGKEYTYRDDEMVFL